MSGVGLSGLLFIVMCILVGCAHMGKIAQGLLYVWVSGSSLRNLESSQFSSRSSWGLIGTLLHNNSSLSINGM